MSNGIDASVDDIIRRNVRVSLNQQQFDALASYVFNTGSLAGTKLLTNIYNRNFAEAVREMDIVTGNGVYMQGLADRRIAERNIWNNGIYVNHR
jgi:lysozyme